MSKKPEEIPEGIWAMVQNEICAGLEYGIGPAVTCCAEQIASAILAAVEAERERCAAIIDATMLCTGSDKAEVLLPRGTSGNKVGLAYAAAIRNRPLS